MSTAQNVAGTIMIGWILLCIVISIGWLMNVWSFAHLNFQAPYKAEVIRGAGILVAPLGGIAGYININD